MNRPEKQFTKEQLLELMGGDAPHYPPMEEVPKEDVPPSKRLKEFVARLFKALSTPGPQCTVFQLSLWHSYCLQTLFLESQGRLTTKPKTIVPNTQGGKFTDLEEKHLKQLEEELVTEIYSHSEKRNRPWKYQDDCYFKDRLKRLEKLVSEAEPYKSIGDELKQEAKELRKQLPHPKQSLTDEQLAIKAQVEAIDLDIQTNNHDRDTKSPAGQHYAHFKKMVAELKMEFGDLEQLGADLKAATSFQGEAGKAAGKAMEKAAVVAGLDAMTSLVLDVESKTRGGGEGGEKKYNIAKWKEKIGAKDWFDCCANLTFPPGFEQSVEELEEEEPFSKFAKFCKKEELPFLVLLEGLSYNAGKNDAGKDQNGELDVVILDAVDNDILLLVEVKDNPPDLVKARAQRAHVVNAVNHVQNPPPAAPVAGGKKAEPTKPALTFKGPKESSLKGPSFKIDIDSLGTFMKNPVQRWAFLSAANTAASNPPIWSKLAHIARGAAVPLLLPGLHQILTHDDARKSMVLKGSQPDRGAVLAQLVEPKYLRESVFPNLVSKQFSNFVGNLKKGWKDLVDYERNKYNVTLGGPDVLIKELDDSAALANLVLVTLDDAMMKQIWDQAPQAPSQSKKTAPGGAASSSAGGSVPRAE